MGIFDYKASVASNINYKLKFKYLFKEVKSVVVINLICVQYLKKLCASLKIWQLFFCR